MCFVLKESYGCAPNNLEFTNRIYAGQVIQVNCTSNRNETKGIQNLEYNRTYIQLSVRAYGVNCHGLSILLKYGEHTKELPELSAVRNDHILLHLNAFTYGEIIN